MYSWCIYIYLTLSPQCYPELQYFKMLIMANTFLQNDAFI